MKHTWMLTGLLILTGCADTTVRHWPTEAQLQSSQDYQTEDARLQSRQVELLEALVSILEPTEHQLGTAEFDETPEPMPDPVSSSGDTAEPDGAALESEPPSVAVDSEADMPADTEPPVTLHGDGVSQDLSDIVIQRWTASWCGPCREWNRKERPKLEAAGITIVDRDIDEHQTEAAQLNIDVVPMFYIRRAGDLNYWRLRHRGYTSADELIRHAKDRDGYRKKWEAANRKAVRRTAVHRRPVVQSPMDATVRITIRTGDYRDIGTGTVIDMSDGSATVLTCAHILNDANSESQIDVEHLSSGAIYQAAVIGKDSSADLAVLRMQCPPIPCVRLATAMPPKNASVFSIGCNGGNAATRVDSRIKEINFFTGPEHVLCSDQPVHGRSGGGLFNSAGELVGVCSGIINETQQGLYGGVAAVRKLMSRLKIPASVTVAEAN